MVLITMGSEYWPKTAEGCASCLVLLTATLATLFVQQDGASELRDEIAARR